MRESQNGFTLIELMIVLFIVAILAAIAVPTYRSYLVKNGEAQAQAGLEQLSIQLNQWRGKALTYKGFVPTRRDDKGNTVNSYNDDDNKIIYIPEGSTQSTARYQIEIIDGEAPAAEKSLVSTTESSTAIDTATGYKWIMFATPLNNLQDTRAKKFILTSEGLRCKSELESFTLSTTNCNQSGIEPW